MWCWLRSLLVSVLQAFNCTPSFLSFSESIVNKHFFLILLWKIIRFLILMCTLVYKEIFSRALIKVAIYQNLFFKSFFENLKSTYTLIGCFDEVEKYFIYWTESCSILKVIGVLNVAQNLDCYGNSNLSNGCGRNRTRFRLMGTSVSSDSGSPIPPARNLRILTTREEKILVNYNNIL